MVKTPSSKAVPTPEWAPFCQSSSKKISRYDSFYFQEPYSRYIPRIPLPDWSPPVLTGALVVLLLPPKMTPYPHLTPSFRGSLLSACYVTFLDSCWGEDTPLWLTAAPQMGAVHSARECLLCLVLLEAIIWSWWKKVTCFHSLLLEQDRGVVRIRCPLCPSLNK